MQSQSDDIEIMEAKKKILLKAIGKVVFEKRKELNKGINKFIFIIKLEGFCIFFESFTFNFMNIFDRNKCIRVNLFYEVFKFINF